MDLHITVSRIRLGNFKLLKSFSLEYKQSFWYILFIVFKISLKPLAWCSFPHNCAFDCFPDLGDIVAHLRSRVTSMSRSYLWWTKTRRDSCCMPLVTTSSASPTATSMTSECLGWPRCGLIMQLIQTWWRLSRYENVSTKFFFCNDLHPWKCFCIRGFYCIFSHTQWVSVTLAIRLCPSSSSLSSAWTF